MYVSSDIIAYSTPRELLISAQMKYYHTGVMFTVTVVLLRTGCLNILK